MRCMRCKSVAGSRVKRLRVRLPEAVSNEADLRSDIGKRTWLWSQICKQEWWHARLSFSLVRQSNGRPPLRTSLRKVPLRNPVDRATLNRPWIEASRLWSELACRNSSRGSLLRAIVILCAGRVSLLVLLHRGYRHLRSWQIWLTLPLKRPVRGLCTIY